MKAVESSTVVAFRALVMLACLVVAPLAAIFGSTFPEVVRAWLINPLLAHTEPTPSGFDSLGRPIGGANPAAAPVYSTENNGAERSPESPAPFWQAPTSAPSPSGIAAGAASPSGDSTTRPAAASTGSGQPAGNGGVATPFASPPPSSWAPPANGPGSPHGATQAAFSSPVDAAPPSGDAARSRFATAAPDPTAQSHGPAGSQGPAGAGSAYSAAGGSVYGAPQGVPPAVQPPAASPAPMAGQGQSEQFAWYEKKLREHGAAYYLLETWGNDGELYRFHCKMAIAGNPNYTRHFEATDPDKLQAMAKVLEQVEAWRGGRLP